MAQTLEFNRHNFELEVQKRAIKVEDFILKVRKGEINKNEWVFTLDEVKEIAEKVAIGSCRNCLIIKGLATKWNKEYCRNQVTKIITDAFS